MHFLLHQFKNKVITFLLTSKVLLILPLVIIFLKFKSQFCFFFLAADSFYYLKVASNFAHIGKFTFDGIYSTNGFHPLWQYFIAYIFHFFNIDNSESQILILFSLSTAFVMIGALIYGYSHLAYTSSLVLPIAVVAPNIYFLLFHGLTGYYQNYGSVWSFFNGMESGFSIFFFSVISLVLLSSRTNQFKLVAVSLVLPALILSRLDDVFILIGFLLCFNAMFGQGLLIKRMFLFCLPTGISIMIYLLYNYTTTGLWMPSSGSQKFGLAAIHNLYFFLDTIFPLKLLKTTVSLGWINESWRSMLLFLPVISSILFLYKSSLNNKTLSAFEIFLKTMSIYVVIKGMYNILFVDLYHQGHWYFPLSLLTFSSQCFWVITKFQATMPPFAKHRSGYLLSSFCLLYLLVLTNVFSDSLITKKYNSAYLNFYDQRVVLKAKVEKILHDNGLIEVDDGIIGYALGLNTLSGTGLCLDKEAMLSKKNNRFLSLAYKRGYRYLASLIYFRSASASQADLKTTIVNSNFFKKEELEKFNFRLEYVDQSGFCIIGFSPI